jgi:hypothetical protein
MTGVNGGPQLARLRGAGMMAREGRAGINRRARKRSRIEKAAQGKGLPSMKPDSPSHGQRPEYSSPGDHQRLNLLIKRLAPERT